jgi:hypothetical protein
MELKVDDRRAPLFLLLSQVLKIILFFRREWQRFEHDHQDESQRFPLICRASVGVLSSDIWSMIRGNAIR